MQLMLPPDPTNDQEMWLVLQFVMALARADGNTFVMLVILLVLYALSRVLMAICTYLFTLYRERAFKPNPHQHLYRILLIVTATVAILGLLLMILLGGAIVSFFSLLFTIFCIVSTVLDWYTTRDDASAVSPSLEDMTADDVLAWQSTIQRAEQQRLGGA